METHADQLLLQKSQPPGKNDQYKWILAPLGWTLGLRGSDSHFGNETLYDQIAFNLPASSGCIYLFTFMQMWII